MDAEHATLDLGRPATRILVAFDPEGPVRTAADRRDLRQKCSPGSPAHCRPSTGAELSANTSSLSPGSRRWERHGDRFEFAHFTDRQIARAVLTVPGAHSQRSLTDTAATVASLRAQRANLKSGVSGRKLELAEALWPVLQKPNQARDQTSYRETHTKSFVCSIGRLLWQTNLRAAAW